MMTGRHALVITSVASMVDQFLMPSIALLGDLGYEVLVCCNFLDGNTCDAKQIEELRARLRAMGVRTEQVDLSRRVLDLPRHVRAYRQIRAVLERDSYRIVHCHSPIGGLLTRLAAGRREGRRIVYTAHGFHFYRGAPLLNWLIFYPVEKLCARRTDVLITINTEDRDLAERALRAAETVYIPGVGIDIDAVRLRLTEAEKLAFRDLCGVGADEKLLLSVGELNTNKNHIAVLRALARLRQQRPGLAWRYHICGQGPLKERLEAEIDRLGLRGHVRLVGFSDRVRMYLACADLFIHPSLREGLSVALMEAVAAEVPVVCSDIRGNRDLIAERERFDPRDVRDIAAKLAFSLEEPAAAAEDLALARRALEKCRVENVNEQLRKVYA